MRSILFHAAMSSVALFAAGSVSATVEVVSNIASETYGQQCDNECFVGAHSAALGGDRIVFTASAGNLAELDTNGKADVFLRERASGTTRLISRLSNGRSPEGDSRFPAISRNGNVIAFVSDADEIVPGDANGFDDVYAYDVATGTLKRASNRADGTIAPLGGALADRLSLSDDGRFLAFATSSALTATGGPYDDVFVRDLTSDALELVSVGPDGSVGTGASWHPVISPDGRWVAFQSRSESWLPPPAGGFNDHVGLFLRDRQTGTTRLVADYNGYLQYPAAFGGGRMLFTVGALTTVPFPRGSECGIGALDLATGIATRVPTPPAPTGECLAVDLTDDGEHALVRTTAAWDPRDTNGGPDLYRIRLVDGTGVLVSARADGSAFTAGFSGFVPGSTDVVLTALSRSVVPNDTNETLDAFLLGSGVRERISVASDGPWPGAPIIDGFDTNPHPLDLSPDGLFAVYSIRAPNAFTDDRDNVPSLAWVDTTLKAPRYVGRLPDGSPSRGVIAARVSADGNTVVFLGRDAADRPQVFVVPSSGGASTLLSTDTGSDSAADLAISDDARYVLYSRAFAPGDWRRTLVHLDRSTGERRVLPRATFDGDMSSDGTIVVFSEEDGSAASQVRQWHPASGAVSLLSRDAQGQPGTGYSSGPAISPDGRIVAFATCASNLATQPAGDGSCPIVRGPIDSAQWMRVELSPPTDPVTVFRDDDRIDLSRDGRFLAVSTVMLVDPENKIWYVSFARHDARTNRLDHLFPDAQAGTPVGWAPVLASDGRSAIVTTLLQPVAIGDRNGAAADVVLWREDDPPLFEDDFE